MTDRQPETQPVRKVRVSPSLPPPGCPEYWATHVRISDCDDDPTFREACADLDAWLRERDPLSFR